MRYLIFYAFVFWYVCGGVVIATENVMSMAGGYDAATELVGNKSRQEEIDLAPNQLVELKQLVAEERINVEFKKVFEREIVKGRASTEASLLAKSAIDAIVKRELANILEPEQIVARRQLYLRRRFHSPNRVFDQEFMAQLGLDAAELALVNETVITQRKAVFEELENLRSKALDDILRAAPVVSRSRFVDLFGNELLSRTGTQSKLTIAQIKVLPGTQAARQLSLVTVLHLPDSLELTSQQHVKLVDLQRIEAVQHAAKPGANRDTDIDSALSEILTLEQRVATVQAMQLSILRSDLLTLVRPEVASYMQLSDEMLTTIRPTILRWNDSIEATQLICENRLLDLGIASLPKHLRTKMKELFHEVWKSRVR